MNGVPEYVKKVQDERSVCFSLVLCDFLPFEVPEMVEILNSVTDFSLTEEDYLKTGETREYYFELSDIVRHYLENRFHLKAPEMTTDEFLNNLKSTKVLRSEHKSLLRDFLSHCDMVKFARYKPEENEIESSYESAQNLVEQTKQTDEGVTKT